MRNFILSSIPGGISEGLKIPDFVSHKSFPAIHGVTTNSFGDGRIPEEREGDATGLCEESSLHARLIGMCDATEVLLMDPRNFSGIIKIFPFSPGERVFCDSLVVRDIQSYARPMIISTTADSPYVFLLSDDGGTMALVHSGHRGTEMNIAGKTIAAISDRLGIAAERMRAMIWPGICEKCYSFTGTFMKEKYGEGHSLSLAAVIHDQLITAGLEANRVNTGEACSCHQLPPKNIRRLMRHEHLFASLKRSMGTSLDSCRNLVFLAPPLAKT